VRPEVRLHPAGEEAETLARLLAASAEELGVDAASLRPVGPAKIERRLAQGGGLVGKITVAFEVEVEGRVRRGSYAAKLLGAGARSGAGGHVTAGRRARRPSAPGR
jgi:hypothetical protein